MGSPRQEHRSGLPFLSLGDLPDPESEPVSPALQADAFITEAPGKPKPIKRQHLYRFVPLGKNSNYLNN